MKRTLSLILALVMAVSLMACGKKDDNKGGDTDTPADSLTILNKVWESYTDDEKFPAAGGDIENSVDDAPGAFNVSDIDSLEYLLSVPADDAALIDDAASLMHMMNANTFTCGALRAKSADDVSTLTADPPAEKTPLLKRLSPKRTIIQQRPNRFGAGAVHF